MSNLMDRQFLLPSQLHHKGNLSPIRPRQKMPTIYRHLQSPSREHLKKEGILWPRDNSYLRKRRDNEVEMQRSTMLMKTGRTSQDNPEWMSVHFDHYKRERLNPVRRSSLLQQRDHDVFNNPRQYYAGRNEDYYFHNMIKQDSILGKDAKTSTLRKTFTHFLKYQPEATGKVGSIGTRDYTIPRPALKVGNSSFVDTYSPF